MGFDDLESKLQGQLGQKVKTTIYSAEQRANCYEERKNKRVFFGDGSNWYLVTEELDLVFVTTACASYAYCDEHRSPVFSICKTVRSRFRIDIIFMFTCSVSRSVYTCTVASFVVAKHPNFCAVA